MFFIIRVQAHNPNTRVMHICVSEPTIIGSDNGLSPGWRQAIIWTNAGILLVGPLGINFSEILKEIHKFSLKKLHFKMSSGKWRPFCLGLHVLNLQVPVIYMQELNLVITDPDRSPRISHFGLVPNRWQATAKTNDDLIKWCMYVSLGCNLVNLGPSLAASVLQLNYYRALIQYKNVILLVPEIPLWR